MTPSQRSRAYEDIAVGEAARLTRHVTQDDVRRFAEMTGDDNPLHMDRAYAETTSFKDVVVHGMLGASLLSTLVGTQLPGAGALWVEQSLKWVHPVRVDDVLAVTCTVTAKHDRDRLLEMDAHIENQSRQVVLTGKGIVRVLDTSQPKRETESVRSMVAVVTGASGGIGQAICRKLAADGYAVAVAYRTQEARALDLVGKVEASGGRAMAVRADVTSAADVTRLVDASTQAFGPPGVVVHAASPPIRATAFEDLPWESILEHFEAEVHGAYLLAQACLPRMRDSQFGRIIMITSAVLDGAPTPKWTSYAVGKAGLAAFARSLAVELGPHGITVNCVSPGMTDTAMIAGIPEKMRLVLARQTPLRRLAQPTDVADAVSFLASPAADYITGETIRVNGGQITL